MLIAWPLIVLVALVGYGVAGSRILRTVGGLDLRSASEILSLGIALYIALAGLALAFDRHGRGFIELVIGAGAGLSLIALVRWTHRRTSLPERWHASAAVGASLIGAVLVFALWRTASFVWNACDDDLAYLYLADRLVLEGDLVDPLNNRRLTSLGGLSALQALFLVRLPDALLPFADAFLGSLLVLFGLWRTAGGRWSAWGIAAATMVILVPSNLGSENTSPILIPVGLAVAAFGACVKLRAEASTRSGQWASAAVVGLLVGSAASLRPQFGFPLALLGLASVLWPPLGIGTVCRSVGLILGVTTVVGGLAVASWRAVNTPFFPLVSGNLDPSWPENGRAFDSPSIGGVLGRLADTPATWVTLAALLVGVGAVRSLASPSSENRSHEQWCARLLVATGIASILWLATLLTVWWNLGPASSYSRFWAPLTLAAVLLVVVVTNQGSTKKLWLKRAAGVATLSLVATILVRTPLDVGDVVFDTTRATVSGSVAKELSGDRYESRRRSYARAAAYIPTGSKVLSVVDVPSLLLGHGFEVHTLDAIGSTSPRPYLPYFQGSRAKLSWFRQHGYGFIIAVQPQASTCLYNRSRQEMNVLRGGRYGAWAPYYFDWFRFLDESAKDSRMLVAEVGPLLVLRI